MYTEYLSRAVQRPTIKKLLPLVAEDLLTNTPSNGPRPAYDFEPGPQEILDTLLPRLTEMQVYQAVLESIASEHAARMVAMAQRHRRCDRPSSPVTHCRINKARQQSITNELLDISGGAEALAQTTRAETTTTVAREWCKCDMGARTKDETHIRFRPLSFVLHPHWL